MATPPSAGARQELFHRRHGGRGLRVVLADDDHDTVATLALILENAGHEVYPLYDGRDVLPRARLVRPDAIILDIQVPGMSGYAVAQAIRYSFTDARRPLLIAISGKWNEAPDRQVGRQVGFDHHFAKPCDPQVLVSLLASLQRPDAP